MPKGRTETEKTSSIGVHIPVEEYYPVFGWRTVGTPFRNSIKYIMIFLVLNQLKYRSRGLKKNAPLSPFIPVTCTPCAEEWCPLVSQPTI